jgi:ring-1,2-phenylacetyl-CoA epoxidase subunit PaaC
MDARGHFPYATKYHNQEQIILGNIKDADTRGEVEIEQMNSQALYPTDKDRAIRLLYLFFRDLMKSSDETISGLAAKSIKEVTYHVRHAGDWVVRLGDGTEESHQRIQKSLNELWPFTNELFEQNEVDELLIHNGAAFNKKELKVEWGAMVNEIITKATLIIPSDKIYFHSGGINGVHSEHLGFLLAEMQYLPRMYPDAIW